MSVHKTAVAANARGRSTGKPLLYFQLVETAVGQWEGALDFAPRERR